MNKAQMFEGPAHNLVWKNHFNEIMVDVYKRYWDSIETSEYDGFGPTSIKFSTLTKEEFINKIKTDDEFAKKWGVKISERELSLEERFNLRYPGGKFSVFQENYPNTHKRNDPNGLLDTFDIPTKIITLEYKEEKVSYHE